MADYDSKKCQVECDAWLQTDDIEFSKYTCACLYFCWHFDNVW